jgi:hypothetical protein
MPKRNRMSDAEAIIAKNVAITESGCWVWIPNPKRRYPQVMIDGQMYGTHRLSYTVHRGPITDGLCVCHTCDQTRCCNPDHLFLGTHAENMQDMVKKDRGGWRERGKLTDVQVREIRRKHARGVPASWIASEYGIAASYVRDIVTRRIKRNHPTRHHAS